MINKDKIKEIIIDEINKDDIVLVDLQVNSGNLIKITLDSLKGVSIDDCVRINRLIESNFDREIEDYELEVSSYGISQPFILPIHYLKNIEKKVEVFLKNGKSVKGILKKLNFEDEIPVSIELLIHRKILMEGKKKKQDVEEKFKIALEEIQKTKLILEY